MLRLYPDVPFEAVSTDYAVSAEGKSLRVRTARVSAMPVNQIFRGTQRPLDETEIASFVSFESDGAVSMTAVVNFDVFRACVVPASRHIAVTRKGRALSFTLPGAGHYVLEINGVHKPLHIFIDAPEKNAPDPADPSVVYFPAGLHRAGEIALSSHQTLYLAAGARVKGYVTVKNAEDVRICGRGMIDCEDIPRQAAHNAIDAACVKNLRVEDVMLHDAPCFALRTADCEDIRIENVKIIGQWRYNSDGIDLYNSRRALVKGCFVRTFDDCVVLKGGHSVNGVQLDRVTLSDIAVEDCVLWNDWGRALEIGAETVADEMTRIAFRRCEILHFLFIACDVQACGDAHVHDILFEDVNVGEPLDPQCEPRLNEIFLRPMCWLSVEKIGRVSDVTFRRIAYEGRTSVPNRFIGLDADSDIRGVHLDGVSINGEPLTAQGHPMSGFIVNEFVSGVTVNGAPLDETRAHHEPDEETRRSFLIGNGAYIEI